MDYKEKVSRRQEYNHKILEELKSLVEKYPDLRFGQILYNYTSFKGDHDPFYDESVDSYNYIIEVKNNENS